MPRPLLACASRTSGRGSTRSTAERLAGELFFPSGAETRFQRTCLGIPIERPAFWPLNAEKEHYIGELMRQRRGEAYIGFKGIGEDEPYAARIPHVPDVHPDLKKIDVLKRHMAAKYYRPLAEIDREIRQRWAMIRQWGEPPETGERDFRR